MMPENFKSYLLKHAKLTEKEFTQLSSYFTVKKITKGEFLLHKHDICKHSFFVEQGLLRAYTIDDAGKEHVIQFAPENWFITDRSSTFFNVPSELYIDAIEGSTVIVFDANFIKHLLEISMAYRAYNELLLQNHIRHSQNRINQLLSATAEQRYMSFISLYPDLTLRVPQWMIASYLGITPESLSRVRKELAKRNFKPKNSVA